MLRDVAVGGLGPRAIAIRLDAFESWQKTSITCRPDVGIVRDHKADIPDFSMSRLDRWQCGY